MRGHLADARERPGPRRRSTAGIGEKPSVFCTNTSPWRLRSIALDDRAGDARGEHGHEHDHRHADHQRRGGDRGAAGLAHRVLARQPAGDAAQPLERLAGERGERPHEPRARTARRRTGPSPRRRPSSRRPSRRTRSRRTGRRSTRADPAERRAARRATAISLRLPGRSGSSASSSAAIGVTRVARSAGVIAAISATPMPTSTATIAVRGRNTLPVLGQVDADRLHQRP